MCNGSTPGGQTPGTVQGGESQNKNLRLQILLLFYDDRKIDKEEVKKESQENKESQESEDGFSCIVQIGDICANASYKIFGGDTSDLEEKKVEFIHIKERLSGNKEKDKKDLEKYQEKIKNIVSKNKKKYH